MSIDLTDPAMIAWHGSSGCWHAVSAAIPLLRRAKDVRTLRIDSNNSRGEALQAEVMTYLKNHGIVAIGEVMAPDKLNSTGSANLMAAAHYEVGPLVMGAYSHRSLVSDAEWGNDASRPGQRLDAGGSVVALSARVCRRIAFGADNKEFLSIVSAIDTGLTAPSKCAPGDENMPERNRGAIKIKRAYETPAEHDGTRILVDRLWPRGVRKQDAAIDHWFKDVAPSTTLRQWFHHDPARWEEFQRRYRAELSRHVVILNELRTIARKGTLTLVYAARDAAYNHAIVLRDAIERIGRISPSKKNVKSSGSSGSARRGRSDRRDRPT